MSNGNSHEKIEKNVGLMAVLIAVAVGIYVAGLQLLRLPEFTLLSGKIAQRLRRS